MDLVNSQPAKTGRSAMLLEPVNLPGAAGVASQMPSIGSAGHHSHSRSARDPGNCLQSAAKTQTLSGLVFIANDGAAKIGFALKGAGAVVSVTASVSLKSGEAAEAFFCVANNGVFDDLFKTLRKTCLASSSSGVVLFGITELPGQMSLRGLWRKSRFSEMALSTNASRRGVGSEPTTGDWLHFVDLSCVRFGQHGPDFGPDFPRVVRLHLQNAQLT